MKARLLVTCGAALLAVALVSQLPINDEDGVTETLAESTIGDVEALKAQYERWAKNRSENGDSKTLAIGLGYSKALSAAFTRARGLARIDLLEGSVSVEVSGLDGDQAYDVWLIDNRPGAGHSVAPEPGDDMRRLGTLTPTDEGAELSTSLAQLDLQGFEIDLVAVGPGGQDVERAGLLFGSPTLFQKLFHHDRGGWYASLSRPASDPEATGPAPLDFLVPRALAQTAEVDLATLIRRGERLFFQETFGGNGRTCGTCHPAENNLTIDPAFIATLPANDPLFVAEFNPALKALERPKLMRELGLILENLDGFPLDPTNPEDDMFTMRGVPHTLALPTSLEPSDDGTSIPPNQRTGWSGDGAPGSGTLREFATGAVIQHFPRSLKRVRNVDFVLPTERQLLAMEAFQLSLGRQADIDLAVVEFLDDRVENGKVVFLNQTPNTPGMGQCNRCHGDAGANISFADLGNRNFNTGVEQLTDRTARQVAPDLLVPCDGGFGREKNDDPAICSRVSIELFGIGDGTFNTPSLIEAADTPPFFHNNSAATIEDAVLFYNGPEFNDSGIGQAIGGIRLTTTEILEVAAMLRVLNALENIGAAIASEKRAVASSILVGRGLLRAAIAENRDAIEVLRDSVLGRLHPDARDSLRLATLRLREAILATNSDARNRLILDAIANQDSARHDMVLMVPGPLG